MQTTTAETSTTNTSKIGQFGNGRYSMAMSELFKDSQRYLGITETQADRLARSFGAEYGRAMQDSTAKVKLGKLNKNGVITLGESVKGVKTVMTHAISVAKLVSLVNEGIPYGLDTSNVSIGLKQGDGSIWNWLVEVA